MSHQLSDIQTKEAKDILKVNCIKMLPLELQRIWSNIEPKGELPIDTLTHIKKWISKESSEQDYVLIQGDFGATFYLVDYCFNIKRVPIYATSIRQVEEKVENNVTITNRIFKHVNFRKYVRDVYK